LIIRPHLRKIAPFWSIDRVCKIIEHYFCIKYSTEDLGGSTFTWKTGDKLYNVSLLVFVVDERQMSASM
jgi:hypothetical protein